MSEANFPQSQSFRLIMIRGPVWGLGCVNSAACLLLGHPTMALLDVNPYTPQVESSRIFAFLGQDSHGVRGRGNRDC